MKLVENGKKVIFERVLKVVPKPKIAQFLAKMILLSDKIDGQPRHKVRGPTDSLKDKKQCVPKNSQSRKLPHNMSRPKSMLNLLKSLFYSQPN